VSDAVEALRAGKPVILPTDTVYGLCALAETAGPTERLYALKGRDHSQPSALLAADLDHPSPEGHQVIASTLADYGWRELGVSTPAR